MQFGKPKEFFAIHKCHEAKKSIAFMQVIRLKDFFEARKTKKVVTKFNDSNEFDNQSFVLVFLASAKVFQCWVIVQ